MLLETKQKESRTSLTLTKDISEICNSLFSKYNLNAFAYSRVFPDGSRSELWSNPAALKHTFITKKYISDLYTPDLYSDNEKYLILERKIETFDNKLRKKYVSQLSDQKNHFNHDHSFMILRKCSDLCEYFIFYAPAQNRSIINTYLNNLHLFENFISKFKIDAFQLIKIADNNKIVPPWRLENRPKPRIITNALEYYNCKVKISLRERQIIHHASNGKTAKEIAKLLEISYRTVELI